MSTPSGFATRAVCLVALSATAFLGSVGHPQVLVQVQGNLAHKKLPPLVFLTGERWTPSAKPLSLMCSGTEAGSYLRLIDSCITQLKAQGPSRICNESKEEEFLLLTGERWTPSAVV